MNCPLCNKKIKKVKNPINDLVPYFECEDCGKFYIEPPFFSKLEGFKNRYGEEKYNILVSKMIEKTKEELVVFVHDFEEPIIEVEDAIYIELQDLLNEMKIYIEDLNCNEYGD